MKANLVCKGGGIKGIGLVGAISCLEENGYEWDNIAGTSAGAIVAALLAVGYTSKEIKELLFTINYNTFKDKNSLQSIPFLGEFFNILFRKGIYSGNSIEKFLDDKLKEKGKTKFKDVSIDGVSKLKIIASDVTRKKLLVLPDDLVDYNIDPMEFEISKAVRMSLSIPFYYYPIKLKYTNYNCFIVDGGLLSNFPIWVFDDNHNSKIPTFGLNLLPDDKKNHKYTNSTVSYLLDVIQTALITNEDTYFRDEDFLRIINIPTLGIDATDFNIDKATMNLIYMSGFNSAKDFISTGSFTEYLSKFKP